MTARQQFAHYRREFQRGNPLMAWRAFWWARLEGVRVPAWALSYLENVASELLDLAVSENAKPVTDARIVNALGLKKKGRHTMMHRDRLALRNILIVRDVATVRRQKRLTVAAAYETVGHAWNLSDEAVKTICRAGRRSR